MAGRLQTDTRSLERALGTVTALNRTGHSHDDDEASDRGAGLTESRGSERRRLLIHLGQDAGDVLEALGGRLPDSAPGWQFLASNDAPTPAGAKDLVQSLRAAEAVVDLIDVRERWAKTEALRKRASATIAQSSSLGLEQLLDKVEDEFEGEEESRRTPYAVATLVSFRARCECARRRGEKEPPAELPAELTEALEQQIELTLAFGAGEDIEAQAHPFLLYQLMRALIMAEYCGRELQEAKARLSARLREVTEGLLARTTLRKGADAEGVALTFCAAALALASPEVDRPHVEAALVAAAARQEASGCWAQGCSVGTLEDPDGGGELQISTYEIALALAEAVLALTRGDRAGTRPIPRAPVEALWRAVGHVDLTRRQLDGDSLPREGWTDQQVYGEPRVSALASANVLSLAVRFEQLLDEIARHEVLPSYEIEDPRTEYWPDWLLWETYKKTSEPDSEFPILEYLDREVVQAAKQFEKSKPYPWARAKQINALLFGPPGTTKTTIVRAVAQGLDWPLITLGPGDFVQDGLERVEARADRIFTDLHALSRTVVLFDECDELFRKREPEKGSDQIRGIAAFVTASMLPKLQDLHDRGQIVLFILTNHFASMDPAIKRLGRVDHVVGVGPPDEAQRAVILQVGFQKELGAGFEPESVKAAVEYIAREEKHFIRSELARLAVKVAGKLRNAENLDAAKARKLAREELKRQSSPTVDEKAYGEFKDQLKESLPHL
jgi:hypothetical protein